MVCLAVVTLCLKNRLRINKQVHINVSCMEKKKVSQSQEWICQFFFLQSSLHFVVSPVM